MSFTVCSSGSIVVKAGVNVNETAAGSGALLEQYSDEGEAYLCNLVKYDIVTNWDSLNIIYKNMFSEYCTNYGAMNLVMYDMSGYTSRTEAENIVNVLTFRMNEIVKILKEADVQDFMGV